MSPRRVTALIIYVFVLTVLAKLYWPGWPTRDAAPSPPPPASGPQVPQN